MKLTQAIRKETCHITVGVLIGDALMVAVFALLKRLDYTVLLGALLGSAAAVGNFLMMGVSAQRAMDDPDRAKTIVQRSYARRMLAMVVVMVVGFLTPCFHIVAVVVPFLLPGATIHAMRLLGMYKPEEKGGEKQ